MARIPPRHFPYTTLFRSIERSTSSDCKTHPQPLRGGERRGRVAYKQEIMITSKIKIKKRTKRSTAGLQFDDVERSGLLRRDGVKASPLRLCRCARCKWGC